MCFIDKGLPHPDDLLDDFGMNSDAMEELCCLDGEFTSFFTMN